ncbi:hypothetical protein DYB32_004617 [Aphanomyces invadans]|uniref:Uncharacterized protein n=1 Tax=Aphanomyces invadans TaxID=157072 RepID=A0A3R7D126_9STRA|nr:hypothetical protein DYB32_004617 [Aphanomyces invadans]
MDGHLRQAIPRIELPPTSKKLAAHGFADDVLFGGVSIQTLQREDAHNALQATAHALKEWMQRQPGYSESMLHTAIKVAAKKIDALLPPSSQPSSAAPLSTEAMTDPLQPHDHVESSVGLPVPASNDPTDSVATGDEFSEDDVLAFMLLSREEKHLLLEFDTARTRRLIKAQGRLLRGKTKSGPSGHASDTEDDNVVRTTPRLVDKALQEATDALKQRVQDLKAQQSTATDSRIDTSP